MCERDVLVVGVDTVRKSVAYTKWPSSTTNSEPYSSITVVLTLKPSLSVAAHCSRKACRLDESQQNCMNTTCTEQLE